jgi:hypothetical protein
MSDGIVINVYVDSEMCDSDATGNCDWNSGSEEEMSGIKQLQQEVYLMSLHCKLYNFN